MFALVYLSLHTNKTQFHLFCFPSLREIKKNTQFKYENTYIKRFKWIIILIQIGYLSPPENSSNLLFLFFLNKIIQPFLD